MTLEIVAYTELVLASEATDGTQELDLEAYWEAYNAISAMLLEPICDDEEEEED